MNGLAFHLTQRTKADVWLRCPNPIGNWEWYYRSHFFIYASCPSWHKNIKIQEDKILQSSSLSNLAANQTQAIMIAPAPPEGGINTIQ
jgi:hypothetical protein